MLCLGSGLNCELELKLWDGGLNSNAHHIGGGGSLLKGTPTLNLTGKKTSSSEHNGKAPTLSQLSTQTCSSVKNLSDENNTCKKPQSNKTLRLMHSSISNYLGLGDVQDDLSSHMGAFWHQVRQ